MGDRVCYRAYCPECDAQVSVVTEACPDCESPLDAE